METPPTPEKSRGPSESPTRIDHLPRPKAATRPPYRTRAGAAPSAPGRHSRQVVALESTGPRPRPGPPRGPPVAAIAGAPPGSRQFGRPFRTNSAGRHPAVAFGRYRPKPSTGWPAAMAGTPDAAAVATSRATAPAAAEPGAQPGPAPFQPRTEHPATRTDSTPDARRVPPRPRPGARPRRPREETTMAARGTAAARAPPRHTAGRPAGANATAAVDLRLPRPIGQVCLYARSLAITSHIAAFRRFEGRAACRWGRARSRAVDRFRVPATSPADPNRRKSNRLRPGRCKARKAGGWTTHVSDRRLKLPRLRHLGKR